MTFRNLEFTGNYLKKFLVVEGRSPNCILVEKIDNFLQKNGKQINRRGKLNHLRCADSPGFRHSAEYFY